MLVIIVVHDVKSGRLDQARKRIDGNSAQMAKQPGLVFRHTGMEAGKDRVVTVTGWRDAKDRRAWDALKQSLPAEVDPKEVFDNVQSFTFEPYDERWAQQLAALAERRG
jgi:heme-degrading monooxygenase HmoA